MDFTQLLLIIIGLAVAAGGAVALVRGANRPASGNAVPRPYLWLGLIAVGLIIAYLAYTNYHGMDGVEITGLVMFGLAFGAAIAVKLFVTDKADTSASSERSVSAGPAKPGTDSEKSDVKRET